MEQLDRYGYDATFRERFAPFAGPGLEPARVTCRHNHIYDLVTAAGPERAVLPGTLRLAHVTDVPATGDWVVLERKTKLIAGVLPRKSALIRRAAGIDDKPQVLAANLDVALLVTGLDQDFNLRRIERLITLARDGGVRPVIVLNKTDLLDDVAEMVAEAASVSPGIPVHAISALDGTGLDALRAYLVPGTTVALFGSSGSGKSTLVNALAGEVIMDTAEVRAHDSRGRHTTTRRELVPLAGGAILLDTPGMREIALHDATGVGGDGSALAESFSDIETLGEGCRFRDCRHDDEPDCAVAAACEAGTLAWDRLEGWHKLQKERDVAAHRYEKTDSAVKKKRTAQAGKTMTRIIRGRREKK